MKRSAFSLVSVLGALAIIGIVIAISGPLVRTILVTSSHVKQAADGLSGVGQFTPQLRKDVWNARQLTAGNPNTLIIRQADGRTVVWRIADDGLSVERLSWKGESLQAQRQWSCSGRLSFGVEAVHTLSLRSSGDASQPGGRRVFVSQLILARAMQR